jgi:hypothetical protein
MRYNIGQQGPTAVNDRFSGIAGFIKPIVRLVDGTFIEEAF